MMPWFLDVFGGRLFVGLALIVPSLWWYISGLWIEDKKERYAWNWSIIPAQILTFVILIAVGH